MNLMMLDLDGYEVQYVTDDDATYMVRFEHRGASVHALCNRSWAHLGDVRLVGDTPILDGVPSALAPMVGDAIDSVLSELGLPAHGTSTTADHAKLATIAKARQRPVFRLAG